MTTLLEKRCKSEGDGKARCCFSACNKLFKGFDFLKKHMKSKHELFGIEELTDNAEDGMLKRYDAEDIRDRPLPQVEVETSTGLDKKSVAQVLTQAGARLGSRNRDKDDSSPRRDDRDNKSARRDDRKEDGRNRR